MRRVAPTTTRRGLVSEFSPSSSATPFYERFSDDRHGRFHFSGGRGREMERTSKKKKRFGIKVPRESRLLRVISVIVCEGINKTIKLSPLRITFPQVLLCGSLFYLSRHGHFFSSPLFLPLLARFLYVPWKLLAPLLALPISEASGIKKRACAPNSHVASTLLRT